MKNMGKFITIFGIIIVVVVVIVTLRTTGLIDGSHAISFWQKP